MCDSPPRLAYLLCGTPRTGSTLLCRLLQAARVAGRPESYFREEDETNWARAWGLADPVSGRCHYDAFVAAAIRAGTTPNGVFGARVMWGTHATIIARLAEDQPAPRPDDLSVLTDAFGPLGFVHIWRDDTVAQAVSWARAEQTGHWQDDDPPPASTVTFNAAQIQQLRQTIGEHNLGWRRWFGNLGIRPHEVRYEDLVADADGELRRVLGFLGVDAPPGFVAEPPTLQQADDLSAEWITRYRTLHPQ